MTPSHMRTWIDGYFYGRGGEGCEPLRDDEMLLLHSALVGMLNNPDTKAPTPEWKPTHRHRKGGLYRKLYEVIIEADLTPAVIYEAKDKTMWVRPKEEFEDGRFTELSREKNPDQREVISTERRASAPVECRASREQPGDK